VDWPTNKASGPALCQQSLKQICVHPFSSVFICVPLNFNMGEVKNKKSATLDLWRWS